MTRPALFAILLALLAGLLPGPAAAQEARVMVRLKTDSPTLKRALAADRARSLSGRLGLSLQHRGEPAPGLQALRASGIATEALLERLARDPDVEFAEADLLRDARALPNDPLYPGQWYLQAAEPAAIRAESAWDLSTGSSSLVVAVIDTGVRFEHPDLAGRLLAGRDFISDAALAGDGDGRDDDASDNGDFISAEDRNDATLLSICGAANLAPQNSSWHGTRVAGVLAAGANNSQGIAGLQWNGRVLPLRVLGKCGGFDSDIVAAMRWAGGLAVPGLPANRNPARIINLSLGAAGACSRVYQEAVDELRARGVLVVAAAGNETGPVEAPGNCRGVLAVAGVRHIGTKVGYSSMGPEVGIAAPAGNCGSTFVPCLFPINTTSNAGAREPAASIYTDASTPNLGTSFSAPQVAGVAALMLAVNPALTPDDLIARLRGSARPFPSDPALPLCPDTASGSDSVGQCNCSAATCGAGLLDAAAALALAAPPVAAITPPTNPVAGTAIRLDGNASRAVAGRSLVAWQWTLASAPAGAVVASADAPVATLQAPVAGDYQVRLKVTDSEGASDEATLAIAVAAAQTAGASGGGGGGSTEPLLLGLLLAATALGLHASREAASRPPPQDR